MYNGKLCLIRKKQAFCPDVRVFFTNCSISKRGTSSVRAPTSEHPRAVIQLANALYFETSAFVKNYTVIWCTFFWRNWVAKLIDSIWIFEEVTHITQLEGPGFPMLSKGCSALQIAQGNDLRGDRPRVQWCHWHVTPLFHTRPDATAILKTRPERCRNGFHQKIRLCQPFWKRDRSLPPFWTRVTGGAAMLNTLPVVPPSRTLGSDVPPWYWTRDRKCRHLLILTQVSVKVNLKSKCPIKPLSSTRQY